VQLCWKWKILSEVEHGSVNYRNNSTAPQVSPATSLQTTQRPLNEMKWCDLRGRSGYWEMYVQSNIVRTLRLRTRIWGSALIVSRHWTSALRTWTFGVVVHGENTHRVARATQLRVRTKSSGSNGTERDDSRKGTKLAFAHFWRIVIEESNLLRFIQSRYFSILPVTETSYQCTSQVQTELSSNTILQKTQTISFTRLA